MVVISLGVSLIVIDATIVNVMLPQVVGRLHLRTTQAEWITSVYSLTFAALLISFGRAGDLFGRRRLFVTGTVVFMVASLLAARSGGAGQLIGSRALQGAGASMIMPATLSTVNAVFTGRDRHIAFGIWGSMIGGMAAVGPLLGGWLATSYGWRWAFMINIPLGLAIVWGALRYVPETREEGRGRGGIDWAGAVLSALALGSLVCALIEGQTYGWVRPARAFSVGSWQWPLDGVSPIPLLLVLAVVLGAALLAVERARAAAGRPVIVDLTLFRIASFRRGNAVSALISVGELGLLFVLPLYLQNAHGNSPLQVCVAIVPLAVGAFLVGGFAARLSRGLGAARVVQVGMALEVLAVLAVGLTTDAGTTGFDLAPWMFVYGLGLGLTSAQLTNVSLGDVPPAQSGQASGTQSTARQIGSALGIALIGMVFATSLGHVMRAKLAGTDLPETRQAQIVHNLRETAGTYARTLHTGTDRRISDAADQALATAADRGALTTAGILAIGLLLTLRLPRPVPRPEAADPTIAARPGE
jgi:EmrB/QacA subfamily drug resistance transporter